MNDIRARITDRLAMLRQETDFGEERLRALENEVVVLRQALLRIAGATRVLREVLHETETPTEADVVRMESVGSQAEAG